jgi:hypothetical protein
VNRGSGLWTLSGRGWFAVFAIVLALLAVVAGITSTQATNASTTSGSAGGAQILPQPAGAQASPSAASISDSAKTSSLQIVEPPLLGKKAVEVLTLLPVHAADSGAGYERTQQFGEAWLDVDGNGCDTRDDILLRDLTDPAVDGCKVMSGKFVDPYTGQSMSFTRGNDTSTLVQIDHLVALMNAWTTGAQELTQDERQRLANDPTNLLTVSEQTNEAKSDADAAKWLPPFAAVHCEYAARQISVKYAYGLWVTKAEHDALASVLQACPDQPAYRSSLNASGAVPRTPAPTASAIGGSGSTVYYANCTAAHAAGVNNLLRGAPGYRAELDRDGDGVACEG